jgi:hypothetical protein
MTRSPLFLWADRASQIKIIFPIFKLALICKLQNQTFLCSKNIQALHTAIFGHDKQLCPLAQLQIPTASHGINL